MWTEVVVTGFKAVRQHSRGATEDPTELLIIAGLRAVNETRDLQNRNRWVMTQLWCCTHCLTRLLYSTWGHLIRTSQLFQVNFHRNMDWCVEILIKPISFTRRKQR